MGIMYIKRNEARHKMKNIMFKEVFIAGMQGFFSYHKKKKGNSQINRLEENKQTECFNIYQKGIQKCSIETYRKIKMNWRDKNVLLDFLIYIQKSNMFSL